MIITVENGIPSEIQMQSSPAYFVDKSCDIYVLRKNGLALAAMGLIPITCIPTRYYLWMGFNRPLTTSEIRFCKRQVNHVLPHEEICVAVDPEDKKANAWPTFMDFTFVANEVGWNWYWRSET